MRAVLGVVFLIQCALAFTPAAAQDFRPGWAGLASDRSASDVGDSLVVVIVESSSASSTATSSSQREQRMGGVLTGGGVGESGQVNVRGGYEGQGEIARSGRIVGQVSVIVEERLPNGDLRVRGGQVVDIDGQRIEIRVSGRVRPADIDGSNVVLSSRVAEAEIAYDSQGSVSQSGSPRLLNRILSWFGVQ